MVGDMKLGVLDLGCRHTKRLRQQPCYAKNRSLNTMAKLSEKISKMLKKNFEYLDLEKKELKKLQTSLERYIKAVSFTIYL